MRVFWYLSFCFCLNAFAFTDTITSNIHDVEYSRDGKEPTLVFMTSGKVLKLHPHQQALIANLKEMKEAGFDEALDVTFDHRRFIRSIKPSQKKLAVAPVYVEKSLQETYIPTTIADMQTAKSYFREAPYNPKESQCFNRAMVWSYEWWKKHSLKANKILIFFTRNYIRRYDFEWWFHIAPYVHVMDNGTVVERVMDRKYTSGPIPFRKWTDIFMRNDAECPVITKYSEYADYPYTGDCMIIRTHMYTYQPADLQMYEAWGYEKSAFNMQEVRAAYLEAFDINL